MPEKSSAILLSKQPYGDKSVIINILTKNHGLVSCFCPNGFSKSRRLDRLQPLTGIEVVFLLKENREMAMLREIQVLESRQQVFSDVLRTSVAFYMAEFLNRVIRQHLQPDERVFTLVEHYVQQLGNINEPIGNLHLKFTLAMIEAMGIKPVIENGAPRYFNLVEGVIGPHAFGVYSREGEEIALLASYFENDTFNAQLTRPQKTAVFNTLILYLDYQLGHALNLKSPAVLHELLND
jgi:DNA repair protein RecO (recombination protein O)